MMISKNMPRKIIALAAGGSGGHLFPAESLAEKLCENNNEVFLITDKRGINNYKTNGQLSKIKRYTVPAGPLSGISKIQKLINAFKLCIGIFYTVLIFIKKRPDFVVGFGGYASFPGTVAAIILKIPLILHEQNAVLGKANKILKNFAKIIAISFEKTKFTDNAKTILTGMPVRQAILNHQNSKYKEIKNDDDINILVIGGSQGAKILSDEVPAAIQKLPMPILEKIKITQQARPEDIEKVKDFYKKHKINANIASFFTNIDELMDNAQIIISRSGSSSCAELLTIGRPAVFIPFAKAADNHQFENAKRIEEKAAGFLICENEVKEKLPPILEKLLTQSKILAKTAENAKKISENNAAENLINLIINDEK